MENKINKPEDIDATIEEGKLLLAAIVFIKNISLQNSRIGYNKIIQMLKTSVDEVLKSGGEMFNEKV